MKKQKPNIETLEDIIVDVASRVGSRVKQNSFKKHVDVNHLINDLNKGITDFTKVVDKKQSTKDLDSKLKEIAVRCILGLELLDYKEAPGPKMPPIHKNHRPKG